MCHADKEILRLQAQKKVEKHCGLSNSEFFIYPYFRTNGVISSVSYDGNNIVGTILQTCFGKSS